MQYNIDTFIRQLQSNIAKRKEKIDIFECNVMHCKSTYCNVKQDIHSYLSKAVEVDPVVLERYEEIVTEWRSTVKKHQTALLKLVEQQKTDRKMLAYFINEKRYMTNKVIDEPFHKQMERISENIRIIPLGNGMWVQETYNGEEEN